MRRVRWGGVCVCVVVCHPFCPLHGHLSPRVHPGAGCVVTSWVGSFRDPVPLVSPGAVPRFRAPQGLSRDESVTRSFRSFTSQAKLRSLARRAAAPSFQTLALQPGEVMPTSVPSAAGTRVSRCGVWVSVWWWGGGETLWSGGIVSPTLPAPIFLHHTTPLSTLPVP
jgi:hypothetical protein